MIHKCLMIVLMWFCANICYADNTWIPYIPQPIPPTVYVPQQPAITYSTHINVNRPLLLTYQWIPNYRIETFYIEKYGLFCKERTIIQQPVVEWICQPVWR